MTTTLQELSDAMDGRPTKMFNRSVMSEAFRVLQMFDDPKNDRCLIPRNSPAAALLYTTAASATPVFDPSGDLAGWKVAPLNERKQWRQRLLDAARLGGFEFASIPPIDDETTLKMMVVITATGVVDAQRSIQNN